MAYSQYSTNFNRGGLRPQVRPYTERPIHTAISIDDEKARLLDDAFAVEKVTSENSDESYVFSFYVADTSYYFDQQGTLPGPYIDRDGTVHNRPDITPDARYDMLSLNDKGTKPAVRISCTVSSSGRVTDINAQRVQLNNKRAFSHDEADLSLRNMDQRGRRGDKDPMNQLKLLKELATIIEEKADSNRITPQRNKMDADGICSTLNNFGNYLFTLYAYQNKLPIIYQANPMEVPLLGREVTNAKDLTDSMPDKADDIADLVVHIKQSSTRYTTTPSANLDKGYLAYARLSSPIQYVFDAVNMMTLTRFLDRRPNPFSKTTLDALVTRQAAIESNERRKKRAAKQADRDNSRAEFNSDIDAMHRGPGFMSEILSDCFQGNFADKKSRSVVNNAENIISRRKKVPSFILAQAIFENPNKTSEQQRLFKTALNKACALGLSEDVLKLGVARHGAYEAFYIKKGKTSRDMDQPILISGSKNAYSLDYIRGDESRKQVFDRLLQQAAHKKLANLARKKTRFIDVPVRASQPQQQPRLA